MPIAAELPRRHLSTKQPAHCRAEITADALAGVRRYGSHSKDWLGGCFRSADRSGKRLHIKPDHALETFVIGNCSPRCGGCASCQGELNRDQGISAFVGHGLQSAGDTPISRRVFFSTETTTDLLLDFAHAQIALGPVVRERHFGALGEQ